MELKIEQLCKTYPNGVQALNNVSLTISPGMFGLLGPNGAGKSTFMRTLATLQEADQGRIYLDDIDVLKDKHEVRKRLGYLPQEFGLDPKVTCEDLLTHFATLKGISQTKIRKQTVAALLEQTNLYPVRKKKLGGFSGGMKQRFGIAQALLANPQLIVVDEPTAGLDPEERHRFLNLLSEIGGNVIVILSTHIVDDVLQLCQKMAIIDQGRLLLEDSPQRATRAMQGRIWECEVDSKEMACIPEKCLLLSSRLLAGRTIIRVQSEFCPDASFRAAAPTLEDVYFASIKSATACRATGEAIQSH